jgi:hypothetical protein
MEKERMLRVGWVVGRLERRRGGEHLISRTKNRGTERHQELAVLLARLFPASVSGAPGFRQLNSSASESETKRKGGTSKSDLSRSADHCQLEPSPKVGPPGQVWSCVWPLLPSWLPDFPSPPQNSQ